MLKYSIYMPVQSELHPNVDIAGRAIGASNMAEMYVVSELLTDLETKVKFTDLGKTGLQSLITEIPRTVHKCSARYSFFSNVYDRVIFPRRKSTGKLEYWSQKEFIDSMKERMTQNPRLKVFCFHPSTAFELYNRYPDLTIYLWVQNAIPYDEKYPSLKGGYIGWNKEALNIIKNCSDKSDGIKTYHIPSPVPEELVREFEKDDKNRRLIIEKFDQGEPHMPMKVLWLPSGSGLNIAQAEKVVKGLAKQLSDDEVELTINLWTNSFQNSHLPPTLNGKNVHIIYNPDPENAYKSVLKNLHDSHFVLSVPGIWLWWTQMLGIPTFIDIHTRGEPERANSTYFTGKGHRTLALEYFPYYVNSTNGGFNTLFQNMYKKLEKMRNGLIPKEMNCVAKKQLLDVLLDNQSTPGVEDIAFA